MYASSRPTIPMEIQRAIKVEAGHRCAVRDCNEHTYLEIHHINENRNDNSQSNLILLCNKHHKMARSGIIDRKSLYAYKVLLNRVVPPQSSFVRSIECDRIRKFNNIIEWLFTEHSNGEPEYIGQDSGYFFSREVFYKIVKFLEDMNTYITELKSHDASVYPKQDYIEHTLQEIVDAIDDNYVELGVSFKLAPRLPYGSERDILIESKRTFINERIQLIVLAYQSLRQYTFER